MDLPLILNKLDLDNSKHNQKHRTTQVHQKINLEPVGSLHRTLCNILINKII